MLTILLAGKPAATIAQDVAGRNTTGDALPLTLTLERSISLALTQATSLQIAREDERVAAARMLSAYGRFLPAVGVGAGLYRDQGTMFLSQSSLLPYDAGFYGVSAGLSAGMTLFDGFRDQAGLRAAIARRDAAVSTVARAREAIVEDVTEAYYQASLDDRLIGVARANLALSTQRLSQIDAQVREGVKAPPDLYRQQARMREDESAVIAAEARASADRIALLRRLRVDPTQPLILTPALAPSATALPSDSLDVRALSRIALQQRPDLAAAADEVTAADAGIAQARGSRLPRVALGFDVVDVGRRFDRQQQNGVDLLGAASAPIQAGITSQLGHQLAGILSLGISVPVFDQFQSQAEIERAQAVAERSRVLREDLRDQVVGDVTRAVDAIRSARLTYAATTAQLVAAQKAYDAVSGRYDVGMASFIDVATAQTDLTRARSQVEAAVVDEIVARQRLATAIGDAPAERAGSASTLQGVRR